MERGLQAIQGGLWEEGDIVRTIATQGLERENEMLVQASIKVAERDDKEILVRTCILKHIDLLLSSDIMYVYMYALILNYTHTWLYMYIYLYRHIYPHIYTHVYIYIHIGVT
jgi:hypothetical protein